MKTCPMCKREVYYLLADGLCKPCWVAKNSTDDPATHPDMACPSALDYPIGEFETTDGNSVEVIGWDKANAMAKTPDGLFYPCCIKNPLFQPVPAAA